MTPLAEQLRDEVGAIDIDLFDIELLWRHFRREVAHCEPFVSVQALLGATRDFVDRHRASPVKDGITSPHTARQVHRGRHPGPLHRTGNHNVTPDSARKPFSG